jgi:FlaG/FlaF family flagellin (archaellin)
MNNEPNFEGEKMKIPAPKISTRNESTNPENKGAFIVILFAALAVILAGMFYWYKTASEITPVPTPSLRPTAEMNKEPETTNAVAQVESFGAMSTSDELNTIEADLESTNLDSLEIELQQIDTELESTTTP